MSPFPPPHWDIHGTNSIKRLMLNVSETATDTNFVNTRPRRRPRFRTSLRLNSFRRIGNAASETRVGFLEKGIDRGVLCLAAQAP